MCYQKLSHPLVTIAVVLLSWSGVVILRQHLLFDSDSSDPNTYSFDSDSSDANTTSIDHER
jgi:hypothetical protein